MNNEISCNPPKNARILMKNARKSNGKTTFDSLLQETQITNLIFNRRYISATLKKFFSCVKKNCLKCQKNTKFVNISYPNPI